MNDSDTNTIERLLTESQTRIDYLIRGQDETNDHLKEINGSLKSHENQLTEHRIKIENHSESIETVTSTLNQDKRDKANDMRRMNRWVIGIFISITITLATIIISLLGGL